MQTAVGFFYVSFLKDELQNNGITKQCKKNTEYGLKIFGLKATICRNKPPVRSKQ